MLGEISAAMSEAVAPESADILKTEELDDGQTISVLFMNVIFEDTASDFVITWHFTDTYAENPGELLDNPYTYEKTGEHTSVIEIDVGVVERYELRWSSASDGTCTRTLDGVDEIDCVFRAAQ